MYDTTVFRPAPEGHGIAWYAIHVRSKCEVLAHHELGRRGFESFLPMCQCKRRWSDRVKVISSPAFPGYLFCRFPLAERLRILNTPGVAQILSFGQKPAPVDEVEIRSVRALVASHAALSPWPHVRIGQAVRIERGPLTGVEGIVARAEDGSPRVVVSVTLLNRAVAAEVDREWLEAA